MADGYETTELVSSNVANEPSVLGYAPRRRDGQTYRAGRNRSKGRFRANGGHSRVGLVLAIGPCGRLLASARKVDHQFDHQGVNLPDSC